MPPATTARRLGSWCGRRFHQAPLLAEVLGPIGGESGILIPKNHIAEQIRVVRRLVDHSTIGGDQDPPGAPNCGGGEVEDPVIAREIPDGLHDHAAVIRDIASPGSRALTNCRSPTVARILASRQ